jgi:hypothetical protein
MGVIGQLGLRLTYHPEDKRVIAEARPETVIYVGKCPRGDSKLTYIAGFVLTSEFLVGADVAR